MSLRTLAKLRAMPLREIVARGAYCAYTAVERRRYHRGALTRGGLRQALVAKLRSDEAWESALLTCEQPRRFFPWQDDVQRLRGLFSHEYREEGRKAGAIADKVKLHEVGFFGERFDLGPRVQWHADPVTGVEWPRRYHADVPCGRDSGCGDIKYVWELNRHQFLIDLAKVALLNDDRECAAELTFLLDSWLDAAPYGTGAAWACALEPAFRAWSWLWAYHMLVSAGLLDDASHLRWLAGFHDHGHFLYRHLEYHKSPYNHLIGEASALFALGLAFPQFAESTRWVTRGRQVLEGTVGSQFYADGGTVEQSTFYHHATLGFYILSAVLGRRHGQELAVDVWQAIERGIEFSIALVQPDGHLPSIGGADDGKPIRLEHVPLWDFRPYYAVGAVLFGRGDFKSAAGRFWEDALWVLGPGALDAFSAGTPEPPATSQTLLHSGYVVMRNTRRTDADYLLLDCGPQAAGLRRDSVPSAAHGHADCLSVIATLGGRRVLVDPGFLCYNGEPAWEVHFRRTQAHNTITIDGLDQARHVSKMAWSHTYAAELEAVSDHDAPAWASGSHDGYVSRCGVRHRRSVWLRPGGYVLILDELTGRPGGLVRANFQFAPGRLVFDGSNAAVYDGRFELAWASTASVSLSTTEGEDHPTGGWIAPSLGVRVPAPRLVLAFPMRSSTVLLLTVLADRARGGTAGQRCVSIPALVVEGDTPSIGAIVAGTDYEDRILAGGQGRSVSGLGIDTDALLALVRVGKDGPEAQERIGGTYMRVHHPAEAPRVMAGT